MTDSELVKQKSEDFLQKLGFHVNPALPCIESLEEVQPRGAIDVAKKFVAVSYMIRVGHGYPIEKARKRLQDLELLGVLGSFSKRILETESISAQESVDLTWQVEGAQVLAWSLGLAELDHARACDDDLVSRLPAEGNEMQFFENASLRPLAQIQEQADLAYRMHWCAVSNRFAGTAGQLNESIVRERRRALDWIYGVDEDWDEIPMDT